MAITNPTTEITGTVITATDYNTIVNAVNHVLNLKLHDEDLDELSAASNISGRVVGEVMMYLTSNYTAIVPTWLPLVGNTIGDTSSGAGLQNPAYITIYTHLWDNLTTPILYTSGGGASSKGASAAADFAAHKRLQLPDTRGRVLAMLDNPGAPGSANRLTDSWADDVGGAGGSETHTLTEAELASHNHKERYALTNGTGAGYLNSSDPLGQDDQKELVSGGSANATSTISRLADAGSDTAHANVQPTMTLGVWVIYTGVA